MMNVKSTAYLAVKVIAIFTFIKFITYLQGVYSIFYIVLPTPSSHISVFTQILLLVVPILLLLVISMCLWLYADEISDRLVIKLDVSEKAIVNYEDLQSIAFSVVGVIIVADAIPMLVTAIMQRTMIDARQIEHLITIGSQGLKLLIGIWLLFGSRGIVGLIRNLKTAGINKEVYSNEKLD